jgi:hypothetical protein
VTQFRLYTFASGSRDSSVGIGLGDGLDDRGSRVRSPAGAGNFSLHHRVQNGSGTYPASYQMNTRGSFPGGKAAGAWSWPLTSICEGVSESLRTGRLEWELQMAEFCSTRCSCISILWVSLVSFVAVTLCVASQLVVIVVSLHFVTGSVPELLDTASYSYFKLQELQKINISPVL